MADPATELEDLSGPARAMQRASPAALSIGARLALYASAAAFTACSVVQGRGLGSRSRSRAARPRSSSTPAG